VMIRIVNRRWVKIVLARVPGLLLFPTAVVLDYRHYRGMRVEQSASDAQVAAEALGLRLARLLDLTEVCATSPSLVRRLDMEAFSEECERHAQIIDAWVVLVELGETYRHIVNTRVPPGALLPEFPRGGRADPFSELEDLSRASGAPVIGNVFEGPATGTGVVTTGQYIRLADGQEAILSIATDVGTLSALLAKPAANGGQVVTLVDPSRRIVAGSQGIDRFFFTDAPDWMADVFELGAPGAALDQPGPDAIGGIWDVGYHPLDAAPGWMVVAVRSRPQGLMPLQFTGAPLLLALLGVALSSLAVAWLFYRERTLRQLVVAEASSREKSKLLASLAHDIRTPIISLLGAIELADENHGRVASTASARRAAEALLALVDDILELSFLGSAKFELQPSSVDLHRLAEDLIENLRARAASKGLVLQLKVAGTLPPVVEVDRLRLEQVLTNLLTNAIKYTETGLVKLHLDAGERREGKVTVTFTVMDTGIGIAPDDTKRIFREFGRLDRATRTGEPGTGLGLPICQRILRAMGSQLLLESTPEIGSTFRFKLNLPVKAVGMAGHQVRPLAGVTILYAEDEPVIRRVTARRLAEAGAKVTEAADGRAVLAMLEKLTTDLLLLDLQMPVLGGVDVIRRLHADDKPCAFPIFVLTSHISGPQAAEARASGADAILTKPIQVEALAAALSAEHGGAGRNTPNDGSHGGKSPEQIIALTNFRDATDHLDAPGASAFVMEFEKSLRADLSELHRAIDGGDMQQAQTLAHRCLGLCQVMGATGMVRVLTNLEQKAADGDAPAVRSIATAADAVLTLTVDQMRESLRSLPPRK